MHKKNTITHGLAQDVHRPSGGSLLGEELDTSHTEKLRKICKFKTSRGYHHHHAAKPTSTGMTVEERIKRAEFYEMLRRMKRKLRENKKQ